MIAELLTLAALTWQDPSGDAHGAGDLTPPTAAVYSSLAPFDLVEASVLDDALLVIEVRLAGIPDPGRLPNGLTLPVLDLYLDTGEGGRDELLPGPEMTMPAGRGWELALRVHGDDAYLVDADDPDGVPRPVTATRRGDVLRLETGLDRPEGIRDLQVLTGIYDPFRNDAWRPLAASTSAWAFASETPAPPVVDLLADDDAAQREALRTFTLPVRRTRSGSVPWLVLMLAGLGVAIVGLGLRRRVPDDRPSLDAGEASAPTRDGLGGGAAGDAAAGGAGDADGGGEASVPEARREDASADGVPMLARGSGRAAPRVGRGSRRSPPATPAADDDGARTLRTTWADSDGWWVDDASSQEAPRETLWDETGADLHGERADAGERAGAGAREGGGDADATAGAPSGAETGADDHDDARQAESEDAPGDVVPQDVVAEDAPADARADTDDDRASATHRDTSGRRDEVETPRRDDEVEATEREDGAETPERADEVEATDADEEIGAAVADDEADTTDRDEATDAPDRDDDERRTGGGTR